MKTIILSTAMLFIFGILSAQPQEREARKGERPSPPSNEEVMKALDTDEVTAAKLLGIHDEYRKEMESKRDENKKVREEFKAKEASMTDNDYEKLERLRFQADRDRIDLQEKYYNRFLEIVPASDTSKFMRLMKRKKGEHTRSQKRMRHDAKPIPIENRE